jgi:hypothetical protein
MLPLKPFDNSNILRSKTWIRWPSSAPARRRKWLAVHHIPVIGCISHID